MQATFWCFGVIILGRWINSNASNIYQNYAISNVNASNCFQIRTPFNGSCWCTPLMDIRCSGLTGVPDLISTDAQAIHGGIYMAGQNIKSVPQSAFAGLQVQKIVLNFNPVGEKLSSNALNGIEGVLRELYMGDCKIRRVPDGMLDRMDELRHLHLWANLIESLPNGYFKSCRNLRELILWGNKLESITDNTFAGLWKLQKLDLDKNRIHSIDKLAFRHLSNLEVIHLGENQIKTLGSDMFVLVSKLRVLNLDRNQIEHVYYKAFEGLNNLLSLALNHNNISLLAGETFTHLKNLTTIFLHKNSLKGVWPKMFANQKSLYLLNLSNNQLTTLPDGILKQNHRLKVLHVDNNQLRTVQRCVFPAGRKHPSSLKTLSLLGNQLTCDCKMAWLFGVYKSTKISVWGVCSHPPEPEPPTVTNTPPFDGYIGYPGERPSSLASIISPQHYVDCPTAPLDCKHVN